jgi:excisionase family DNA binding protein
MNILTAEEVAAWLKVKPVTVRRLLVSGKLTGFKVGNEWRITEDDLQRFIEQQREKSKR